jgi:hypothetical protein
LKKSFSAWLQLEKKGAANLLPKRNTVGIAGIFLELQKESNTLVQRSRTYS